MKRWLLIFALLFSASLRGDLAVTQLSGFGGNANLKKYNAETTTWITRVGAAGGSFTGTSKSIADALIVALQAKSYNSKIVYLLPLLGSNLAAARVPLRDTLNAGIATNHNFVEGDFSQATGLQGNGSSKYLDSLIKASQLGTTNNGGIGFWDNNYSSAGTGTIMIGAYNIANDNRYVIDVRSSGLRYLCWGLSSNIPQDAVSGASADYYGQRASATNRRFFISGTPAASSPNTTSDSTAGSSDLTIWILAVDRGTPAYHAGRCAVAYMTDGTLADADVADLHSLLNTYLIGPTGR